MEINKYLAYVTGFDQLDVDFLGWIHGPSQPTGNTSNSCRGCV